MDLEKEVVLVERRALSPPYFLPGGLRARLSTETRDAYRLQEKYPWLEVMPVRKFRSIEDMPDPALKHDRGDPVIPQKIRYLWRLSEALLGNVGTCIPRGVRKYRSIDEANADRDRWEQERVDRIRAQRSGK